jgi:hypothetical protein
LDTHVVDVKTAQSVFIDFLSTRAQNCSIRAIWTALQLSLNLFGFSRRIPGITAVPVDIEELRLDLGFRNMSAFGEDFRTSPPKSDCRRMINNCSSDQSWKLVMVSNDDPDVAERNAADGHYSVELPKSLASSVYAVDGVATVLEMLQMILRNEPSRQQKVIAPCVEDTVFDSKC